MAAFYVVLPNVVKHRLHERSWTLGKVSKLASDGHEAIDYVLTTLAELRTRVALLPCQIALAVMLAKLSENLLKSEGEAAA